MERSVLASVLVIGVVAAMLGAGTMAFFSDTETVGVHDIQAGTLNLKVGDDDPCTVHITFTNIKPGFSATKVYSIKNTGTVTGWLSVGIGEITNKENGRGYPELDDGDTTYGALEGELGQYLGATITVYRGGNRGGNTFETDAINKWAGKEWSSCKLDQPDGTLTLEFRLPTDVGNRVQSDSVEFDIILTLHQA